MQTICPKHKSPTEVTKETIPASFYYPAEVTYKTDCCGYEVELEDLMTDEEMEEELLG